MPDLKPNELTSACDMVLNAGTADQVVQHVHTILVIAGYPPTKLPGPDRWPVDADGNLVLGYDRLAAFLQLAHARWSDLDKAGPYLKHVDLQPSDDAPAPTYTYETETVRQLRDKLQAETEARLHAQQEIHARDEAIRLLASFGLHVRGMLRLPWFHPPAAQDLGLQWRLLSSHAVIADSIAKIDAAAKTAAAAAVDSMDNDPPRARYWEVAAQIVDQMHEDDKASFSRLRHRWRDVLTQWPDFGKGGAWAHLTIGGVLDAIKEHLEDGRDLGYQDKAESLDDGDNLS